MENSILGFCGLDCNKCPIFLATIKNDIDLKKKIANEWPQLNKMYLDKGLTAENMVCYGCKSHNTLFLGCQNCQIRNCCLEKNYDNCAICDDFNTCEMIKTFFTQYKAAEENLKNIEDRL